MLRALLILLLALSAIPAWAGAWPERSVNPHPDADDVVLPMPCGGKMVFRRVVVPVKGALDDQKIVIGGGNDQVGLMESARPAYLAAGLADAAGAPGQAYLIGKYKVTAAQYQALSGTCPTVDDNPPMPAAGINWFEGVQFAASYTEWLLKNAAESLPKVGDVPSFVRLPTEVEWEFAARGGTTVSESEFRDTRFPMKEPLARYAWYQGTQSANGKLQPLGLLQPNPLKLYDMLGDLDELVFDPFQATKQGRLQGQIGGVIVKGGNYTTSEGDIRSSYRQEIAPFDAKGQRHSKTVGFRVALASTLFTSTARYNALKSAWDQLSGPVDQPSASAAAAATVDPRQQLTKILAAEHDEAQRKALTDLSAAMTAQTARFKEQQERAARVLLRLGASLGRKIHDDQNLVKMRETLSAGLDEAAQRTVRAKIEADKAAIEETFQYYLDNIVVANQEYSYSLLENQTSIVISEFKERKITSLQEYIKIFLKHIRKSGSDVISDRQSLMGDLIAAGASK